MSARLTVAERQLREETEEQWQQWLTALAGALGYRYVHFRPAMTAKGWRTPVQGPLGKGWPDLEIVGRGRVVYVECKREVAELSPEQETVHAWLRENRCEVYVWRPSDRSEAIRVLGGSE